MKGLARTLQIGRDNGTTQRDDKTSESHTHRAIPLVGFRPVLWVLRVVYSEGHELVILEFPSSPGHSPLEDDTCCSLREIFLHVGIVVQNSVRQIQHIGGILSWSSLMPLESATSCKSFHTFRLLTAIVGLRASGGC